MNTDGRETEQAARAGSSGQLLPESRGRQRWWGADLAAADVGGTCEAAHARSDLHPVRLQLERFVEEHAGGHAWQARVERVEELHAVGALHDRHGDMLQLLKHAALVDEGGAPGALMCHLLTCAATNTLAFGAAPGSARGGGLAVPGASGAPEKQQRGCEMSVWADQTCRSMSSRRGHLYSIHALPTAVRAPRMMVYAAEAIAARRWPCCHSGQGTVGSDAAKVHDPPATCVFSTNWCEQPNIIPIVNGMTYAKRNT